MKKILVKIPAMLAVLISLFSFGCLLTAVIYALIEVQVETGAMGVSDSFAFWVLAVIASLFSLIFYTIDAIISLVNAFCKRNPLFHFILAAILLGGIPMLLFVGGRLGISILIWFSYYLAMTILETISIIKHIKAADTNENQRMILTKNEKIQKNIEFERKSSDFRCTFEIK